MKVSIVYKRQPIKKQYWYAVVHGKKTLYRVYCWNNSRSKDEAYWMCKQYVALRGMVVV